VFLLLSTAASARPCGDTGQMILLSCTHRLMATALSEWTASAGVSRSKQLLF